MSCKRAAFLWNSYIYRKLKRLQANRTAAASAAWYIMKWLFPIFLDFIEKVYNMPKALTIYRTCCIIPLELAPVVLWSKIRSDLKLETGFIKLVSMCLPRSNKQKQHIRYSSISLIFKVVGIYSHLVNIFTYRSTNHITALKYLAIFDLPIYLVLLYNVRFWGLFWTPLPTLI